MSVEQMEKLRQHLDVAIEAMKTGALRQMTEVEKRYYANEFGRADLILGEFMIVISKKEFSCSNPKTTG